jgi:hypothetical protein
VSEDLLTISKNGATSNCPAPHPGDSLATSVYVERRRGLVAGWVRTAGLRMCARAVGVDGVQDVRIEMPREYSDHPLCKQVRLGKL